MADAHLSEAECLLEQGANYPRRIGLEAVIEARDPIFAGFKHGAFSLYCGDAPIYHFDLEGRWQRVFSDGTHYLKGLDARVHAIDRVREGPNLVLKRRELPECEAADLDERVRATAATLFAEIESERMRRVEPKSAKAEPLEHVDLCQFLEQIAKWDGSRWLAHRELYRACYSSAHFLPPECQNAVVLEATPVSTPNGASSASAFANHARNVASLWGRRLLQSRLLFFAGSGVLKRPIEDLAECLAAIAEIFPIEPRSRTTTRGSVNRDEHPQFDGVHAYLDDFSLPRPVGGHWRTLADRRLIRVSLGVPSGDREVRSASGKDWSDEDLQATVREIKEAGIGVSVLIHVGAGGVGFAESHAKETIRLVSSLELVAGDFVFLLDEREQGLAAPSGRGMQRFSNNAWLEQQAKIKEGLAPLKERRVKVLPYTMEKQWT